MSQKLKSSLYLAGFVIASLVYYNQTNSDQSPQKVEMASADMEQVSSAEALD
ncbi:hypothetical protein ACU8V7_16345 [Zobellia nedashkovskayae]